MADDYEAAFHEERGHRIGRLESDVEKSATKAEVKIAADAATEAKQLATDAANKEFEHLNKLRETMCTKEQHDALAGRVAVQEQWKAKATGVGLVLVVIAGAIGAVIGKALGG